MVVQLLTIFTANC